MSVSPQSQSTISQSSTSSFSEQFSSGEKYNGMLKRSISKQIRNRLYLMMNYFDNTVPSFYTLHEFITFWRALQLIGPSFGASSKLIWDSNSVATEGISTISIFFHLMPPKYRSGSSLYFELIYFGLLLIYFLSILGACFYFSKHAKLPSGSPTFYTIFMNTFLYILPPISLNFSGEVISNIIQYKKAYFGLEIEIVAVILVIAISIGNLIFLQNIMALSLTFRPTSFLSTSNVPQLALCVFTYVITFLSAVSSQLSKYPQAAILIVVAILYFATIGCVSMGGTFVSLNHRGILFCVALSGGLNQLCLVVYLLLGKQAGQPQFFVFIASFIISYFIGYSYLHTSDKRRLKLIDEIQEDLHCVNLIKGQHHFLSLVCTGMEYAHPLCLSWSLFNIGTEKYPEDAKIWSIFAKFTAIYPEESNILGYISRNIVSHHLNGPLPKETIGHANLIQMQRENSLSTDLKRKITSLQKSVTDAKRKLRSIWDLVIQGNVNDLEFSINTAYAAQNRVHNDYTHLITQYPNNRFVARAYARFLHEIVGDSVEYSAWLDKVRILTRGLMVNEDTTCMMGLHAFPQLPSQTKNSNQLKANTTQSFVESESISISQQEDIDEENGQLADQCAVLRQRIYDLKIPAIIFMRVNSILLVLLLVILPAVAILVYAPIYINSNSTPLEFMSVLALVRSYNFQLPLWAHHWIVEELPFPMNGNKPMFEKPIFTHIPKTLGSTTETHGQFKYLLHEFCTALENLGNFRSFETSNKKLALVHKVVYDSNSLLYDYYTSINTSFQTKGSVLSLFLDHLVQLSALSDEEPSFDHFGSPKLLNPYLNANNIATNISDALICLTEYISDNSKEINQIIQIVEIVACILFAIIWIICVIFQLSKLRKNKLVIYRCLTLLPKNVVSSVSETLRVLKKDDNTRSTEVDTEISKQEENILKLFASAGDSTASTSTDNVIFIALNLIILICCIINIALLCSIFPKVTTTMTTNAPHLDDVMGTTAYMVGIFLALNNAVIANTNGYNMLVGINQGIGGRPILSSLSRVSGRLATYLDYYHKARYGWPETNEPPFEKYDQQLEEAAKIIKCKNISEIFTDYHSIYSCFSIDSQILLFEPFVTNFIQPVVTGVPGSRIRTTDQVFIELWILTCNLFDTLFFPMFDGIVPAMTLMMSSAIPDIEIPVIILILISIIVEIFILFYVDSSEKKMRYALNLLNLCPISAVLQTSHVNDVLLGDFSDKLHESALRDTYFFEELVKDIPIAILIANPQHQIITANKRLLEILNLAELNGDIRDFISPDVFTQLFSNKQGGEATVTRDKTTVKYKSCQISQHFIVFASDTTELTSYLKQIKDEKNKSDFLLASILPTNLVGRVQSGETSISFTVQSASVIFLNICQFTSFAHSMNFQTNDATNSILNESNSNYNEVSNEAAKVLSSLNALYQKFDQLVSQRQTLTKVKNYGDCYMVAGGIFDEVSMPAEHTREAVEFALDAIEEAKTIGLNLRAGINTGGPVVAGIIGLEKPTFEIFGTAIVASKLIEATAPQNSALISRSVYELIYGMQFEIKEKGQIEVGASNIVTYTVERKY